MPEESENSRKHQYPPPKVTPPGRSANQLNSFAPTTRAALISSTSRSRDTRMHTSVQRLDLSNEFTQPLLSPELLSKYSSTHFPSSNHVNSGYQNLPQPPLSSGVFSPNQISPATGSPHVPDSPTSSKYPPAPMTEHSDLAASSIQRQVSLTPSGPPDYRSTCSSDMDSHIPFAIANESTQRDDQYTNYQYPSASGSGLPSPRAWRDTQYTSYQQPSASGSSLPSPKARRDDEYTSYQQPSASGSTMSSPQARRDDQYTSYQQQYASGSSLPSPKARRNDQYTSYQQPSASGSSMSSPQARRDDQYTSYQQQSASGSSLPSPQARRDDQYTSHKHPSASGSSLPSPQARRDDQYTSYKHPSASGSSLHSPQAQIASLSIPHESSLPFQYLPSVPNSNPGHSSSSSKRRSHQRHRDSTSPSG